MKKYVFMALVAATTITFIGCKEKDKPGPDPTGNAKVVLNAHTLELAVGAEEKLRAALDPTKEGVEIIFNSADPTIATVNGSGLVTGIAPGEVNIIASAEGYKADTCVVTIIDAVEAFKWDGYTIWNLHKDQRLSEDTAEVKLANGMTVHCFTVAASYRLWSGMTFTGERLAGAGYVVMLENVPTWIITEALDDKGKDYYYVSSTMKFVQPEEYDATKAACANTVPVGKLANLEQHIKWLQDETGEEASGITGASVWYINYDTERYFPYEALIGTGAVDGDETEAYYKINVAWSDGIYGLAINEEGNNFADPYAWANFTNHYYENLPPQEEEVHRMMVPVNRGEDALSKAVRTKSFEKFYMAK